MMMSEDRRTKPFFDILLLLNMYALIIIGVLAISVATFDPDVSLDAPLLNRIINSNSGRWQAIFSVASIAVVWFVVSIPYEHFRNYARLYYYGIMALLVLVLGMSSIRSVSAWFQLSLGRMFQPSEFAKITMILMLARTIANTPKPMGTFKNVLRMFYLFLLPAGFTFLQGETGTVLVMGVIFYLMLFFGGADWKWLVGLFLLAAAGVTALFAYSLIGETENYKLLRLVSFLDPQRFYNSHGYQILNAQQAIGSGGMSGIGLFVPGSMSQLNYVPEDWTDFIFATIGEAVGFVGCLVILALYLTLMLRMLYLARFTYDKFGRMIILGVLSMIFVHVIQNVAMTIGLMPITGIPLPFISYGGSNLVTNVTGISLVLNVTKNRSTAMTSYAMPMTVAKPARHRRRKKKIYVNTAEG
ncbi:MAG: FtsW/RodA/SpoVE family cell cycle protein [Clostridiales bacterium]|nr:FtsW/RodA/SpoVE family cell cycle protein [Clostridiales bacterium]